jgi:hypothetical protein
LTSSSINQHTHDVSPCIKVTFRALGDTFLLVSNSTNCGCTFEAWMEAFVYPSTSSAHHTDGLSISGCEPITTIITWVRPFSPRRKTVVKSFAMERHGLGVSLLGSSPTLKFLDLTHHSVEGLEVGRESVESGGRGPHLGRAARSEDCEAANGSNPSERVRGCVGDFKKTTKAEGTRVMGGRVGGVRKYLHPSVDRTIVR